jgi:hypothetical protein
VSTPGGGCCWTWNCNAHLPLAGASRWYWAQGKLYPNGACGLQWPTEFKEFVGAGAGAAILSHWRAEPAFFRLPPSSPPLRPGPLPFMRYGSSVLKSARWARWAAGVQAWL